MPSSRSCPSRSQVRKLMKSSGLSGRQTLDRKHAPDHAAVGIDDFERVERTFAKLDGIGLDPVRGEVGFAFVG